jgi:hypothetical protein
MRPVVNSFADAVMPSKQERQRNLNAARKAHAFLLRRIGTLETKKTAAIKRLQRLRDGFDPGALGSRRRVEAAEAELAEIVDLLKVFEGRLSEAKLKFRDAWFQRHPHPPQRRESIGEFERR